MKKNTYFVLASTALLLASCADDKFTGDGGANGLTNGTAPIAFNMQGVGQTRADASNSAAADSLKSEFIVWGEKVNSNNATENVFKNYRVKYTSGSANTTTSNTKDWEYVGFTPYNGNGTPPSEGTGSEATAAVSPSIYADANTKQIIKYWDMNATSYTFTAVSALQNDITKQLVKITKTESAQIDNDKGYTIELATGAHANNIWVSDKNTLTKASDSQNGTISATAQNKYGGIAQLTFRNFMSKIRFGIYETVPGYKVVITGIKYKTANATGEQQSDTYETHTNGSSIQGGTTFGITGNFVVVGNNGGTDAKKTTYTVTYETDGKAKVTVNDDCNKATYVNTTGTNWLSTSWTSTTGKNVIAESNTKPTYDRGDNNAGTYTTILPNPSNTTDMTLEISYDLYSEDTGEKISVDYKKAVVPAAYCKWKSNYAYTYIFKISDKSAELYPITFDAVVETSENGNQETITTVSEPSITTFGYDATNKKVITDKDEYENGNVIYASVVDGSSTTANLSVGETGNVKLYTVTSTDVTNFPITEASVADAVEKNHVGASSSAEVAGNVKCYTESLTTDNIVSKVPGEDGVDRTLCALKWTASNTDTSSNPKYYAVEYTKTTTVDNVTVNKKYYKIVKIAAKASK